MKSNVSLLRRLGAVVYDIFLAFSLAFFIVAVVLIIFFEKQSQNNLFIFASTLISTYFYFTWSWVKGGQTLGMRAWGVRIVQNSGKNVTHKQALIRFILAIFSFTIGGFGFIYQLFNADNLTWHDRLSHTLLVKK